MVAAVALLGAGLLTTAAGPVPVSTSGGGPTVVPASLSAALEQVRLQPFRLVYRQVEGTFLKGPSGVFFDQRRGEVYVADTMNHLVAVYDRDGVPLFAFGYNGEVKEPRRAVVDGRDRIHVLAGVDRKIAIFNYRGEYLHDFSFPGLDGKPVPTAITADIEGNVYIADATSGNILVYDAEQRLKLRFGAGRDGRSLFQSVQGMAVDRQGQIFVTDAQGIPLQVFSPEGRFLRGWGEHTAGPQNFSLPGGVALDSAGRVIVVDMIRQVVSLFTPDGLFLARFGGMGFAAGAMAFPADIASDGERRIYVVERVGNRLQILDEQPAVAGPRRQNGTQQVPRGVREDMQRSLKDLMRSQ
jgi:DNA-binding beta-propeller fold protein YncE